MMSDPQLAFILLLLLPFSGAITPPILLVQLRLYTCVVRTSTCSIHTHMVRVSRKLECLKIFGYSKMYPNFYENLCKKTPKRHSK